MPDAIPFMKGTLDLLVMKALSWSAMHGVEIITWLEQSSEGALEFDDSAVYQALYRLEKRELVSADWGVSDHNRRARYYKLTARGRTWLQQETARLLQSTRLVESILTAAVVRRSR